MLRPPFSDRRDLSYINFKSIQSNTKGKKRKEKSRAVKKATSKLVASETKRKAASYHSWVESGDLSRCQMTSQFSLVSLLDQSRETSPAGKQLLLNGWIRVSGEGKKTSVFPSESGAISSLLLLPPCPRAMLSCSCHAFFLSPLTLSAPLLSSPAGRTDDVDLILLLLK